MARRHISALEANRLRSKDVVLELARAARELSPCEFEEDPAVRLLALRLAQRTRAFELNSLAPFIFAQEACDRALEVKGVGQ